MNATITLPAGSTITLTTDHASSSYGRPVLLLDDATYGPGDTVDIDRHFPALDAIDSFFTTPMSRPASNKAADVVAWLAGEYQVDDAGGLVAKFAEVR